MLTSRHLIDVKAKSPTGRQPRRVDSTKWVIYDGDRICSATSARRDLCVGYYAVAPAAFRAFMQSAAPSWVTIESAVLPSLSFAFTSACAATRALMQSRFSQ